MQASLFAVQITSWKANVAVNPCAKIEKPNFGWLRLFYGGCEVGHFLSTYLQHARQMKSHDAQGGIHICRPPCAGPDKDAFISVANLGHLKLLALLDHNSTF